MWAIHFRAITASQTELSPLRVLAHGFSSLTALLLLVVDTSSGQLRIGQNFRIYPSSITQTETFITRHPGNPAILFASANTINLSSGFISEGIYVSTDAGLTWSGSDSCNGAPITFHRGDPGIAIDRNGTFLLIRLSTIPGLYAHYSTDNGQTWSSQRTIATEDQDRATLTADNEPSSGHYGRAYAVWVQFATPFPVLFSYTDNGGVSWSTPDQINNPPMRCQGGEVAIGPNGAVNVTWAGVINLSPFTEDYAGFASSTDGGATWFIDENAFDMNGIAGTFPEKSNIRVNGLPRIDVDKSGGTFNGRIYVVTCEKDLTPAGSDPDIVLHYSTNSGQTWSAGIRVNQDPLNNGKFQYFPAIHIDDGGGVNVLYYDDRNTTVDSASVYLSRSTNGGTTWTDYEVSDHNFLPQPIGGLGQGYQGDNIGLASVGDTLWPVWMDNSSGIYQVWTCPIDIPSLGTDVEPGPGPLSFELKQNYPNPFNPQTVVEFALEDGGDVKLEVFNLLGELVSKPIDTRLDRGTYRFALDASGWANGVYLYQLRTADRVALKKMVLIK
jgi:hypothetical protein